jgi:nucleoside-diphosphate-sugar epimerase
MTILIFGGSGFIGTRLCSRLSKVKKRFLILDKNRSKTFPNKSVHFDVREEGKIPQFSDQDIIVNLAAEHRDDVKPTSLYYETNVAGAENVCEIARRSNISKIVFTSSVAVYGFPKLMVDEKGKINPFNHYGKTKHLAELTYKKWQLENPSQRSLVIIRPTVVFGEKNRGNVFNLFKQVASGKFAMIGNGQNRKSMAYVENVASFIEFSLKSKPGIFIYNYVDKPDLTMESLVDLIEAILGKSRKFKVNIPYFLGLVVGYVFDFFAFILRKKLTISSIRIKKFCSNSAYTSCVSNSGFSPPVPLSKAIKKTIDYEFKNRKKSSEVFYTE